MQDKNQRAKNATAKITSSGFSVYVELSKAKCTFKAKIIAYNFVYLACLLSS
jgi:hypothetical protein